jgi:hypothetical protein
VRQAIEHRQAQLVQRGERQLHFRFHTDGAQDVHVRRGARHVVEEGGLPHTCLAAEHEHAALARADRRDHLVERGTLRPSPE